VGGSIVARPRERGIAENTKNGAHSIGINKICKGAVEALPSVQVAEGGVCNRKRFLNNKGREIDETTPGTAETFKRGKAGMKSLPAKSRNLVFQKGGSTREVGGES